MTTFTTGDRVIELPGTPSQRCGTVIEIRRYGRTNRLYPVVLWDSGYHSFSSLDLGLRRFEGNQQLALFGLEETHHGLHVSSRNR